MDSVRLKATLAELKYLFIYLFIYHHGANYFVCYCHYLQGLCFNTHAILPPE